MSLRPVCLAACLAIPSLAAATPGAGLASIAQGYTVGDGITRAGVTVFPVTAEGSPKLADDEQVIPFADALQQGVLTVTEAGHDMQVASLRVHNRGKDPVLVMAGEIVEGGQQDRVITQDILVPPSDRPIALTVNCVERSRWSGGSSFSYGGQAEMGLRRVVQVRRNQDATWEAVSDINGRKASLVQALGYDSMALRSSGGTYMASLESGVLERQVAKTAQELHQELSKEGDVVGIVVAVGGRVVGSDVFGAPEVWQRVSESTLAAVARDAMTAHVSASFIQAPEQQVAADFLVRALDGYVSTSGVRGIANHTVVETSEARSYVLADADGDLLHMASYALD